MLAAWGLHPSQRKVRQHPVADDHSDEGRNLGGTVVHMFRGGQDFRHGIVLHLQQEPVRVVVEGQVAQPGDEWWNRLQINYESEIRTVIFGAPSQGPSDCFCEIFCSAVTTSGNALTFTKKPPASMKVITVTEARVVAFLISSREAPIANPSPCSISFC